MQEFYVEPGLSMHIAYLSAAGTAAEMDLPVCFINSRDDRGPLAT